MPEPAELVLTCEHATNRIPAAYASFFLGAETRLASHQGYDIGALAIAQQLGRAFGVTVIAAPVSRLVADANRAPRHPKTSGSELRGLLREQRAALLARYHSPHRAAVERCIRERIAAGRRIVHVGVHTFTPVLIGIVRKAEIGLLYDPSRRWETLLCQRWQRVLAAQLPGMRIRRNYPYRGVTDGLTRTMRERFADDAYAGIELEVSQALVERAPTNRRPWLTAIERSLGEILADA